MCSSSGNSVNHPNYSRSEDAQCGHQEITNLMEAVHVPNNWNAGNYSVHWMVRWKLLHKILYAIDI